MNGTSIKQVTTIVPLLALLTAGTFAERLDAGNGWTSFRNGGASTAASDLPTKWSPEKGIAWQRELVGYGQSAPVIWNDRVFVSSVDGPMCETLVIQSFDLKSGEPSWSYERPTKSGHPSNYMNARAAPTPLVDEHAVYVFFETGDFVCLDHQGELLWHRDEAKAIGGFKNNHGLGSSPAIDGRHLYLLLEHDGPSSLIAIDKKTGDTVWQTERKSTKSWASPIVTQLAGGEAFVIVSSGGRVTGYAASDGKQAWEIDGFEGNSIPSPTSVGDFLLVGARLPEFASDGQVKANSCLDLSNIKNGKPEVVWRADKAICEYASPVTCGDHAYFVNKANVLHCIDVATGEIAYRQRLSLDCWATPIVSGNAIYFFAKNGQSRVVGSGAKFTEIASNSLWDVNDPPAPLHYVEAEGGHGHHGGSHGGGHGEAKHGGGGDHSHGEPSHGKHAHGEASNVDRAAGHGHGTPANGKGRPGGGMVARMLAGDANKDGVLEGDEIPSMFRAMMSRIDTDGDGKIDNKELEAMAKSFAERRKNAQASSRDPIVYGVAAAGGRIAVRTGTRLYLIDGK